MKKERAASRRPVQRQKELKPAGPGGATPPDPSRAARRSVPVRAFHPARPRRRAQGSTASRVPHRRGTARAPCSLRRRSSAVATTTTTSSQGRSSSTCRTWTRSRTYFLTGGGKAYRLTKVSDGPDVLARARRSNSFLRQVPDRQITHHIEGASFTEDKVSLVYLSSDIDGGAGTWSMSAVYVQFGPHLGGPRLPGRPSADPQRPAAAVTETEDVRSPSCRDGAGSPRGAGPVRREHAGRCHPGRWPGSVQPRSRNRRTTSTPTTSTTIRTPRASPRRSLSRSTDRPLRSNHQGKTNAVGWGTLTPVINDATGLPFKNTKGFHAGRIEYLPVFHPDIVQFAGPGGGAHREQREGRSDARRRRDRAAPPARRSPEPRPRRSDVGAARWGPPRSIRASGRVTPARS